MVVTDRVAARWESTSFFTIDINFTDGLTHQMAIYGLDWDGNNRAQRVDVLDGATNSLLDSRSISSFNGGQYLVWNVRGHVKLQINKTGGKTAVVSGLYFGGAMSTPTTTPCSISISSSSLTISNNGSANISAQLLDFSGSGTITANPSATILVSPTSRTVSGSNTVSYTIGVKNKSGNVVFSSPCGSRIVPITVR